MSFKKNAAVFQHWRTAIDWELLAFLLLFLNVKLVIKIAALIVLYALRRDFKFGFTIKDPRIPLFYIVAIALVVFNWLISGQLTNMNYSLATGTAIIFWLMCILASHQVKLSVYKNTPAVIHQTLLVFFIINAAASLAVYGTIVWETGTINPYRYQGDFQKYFIGTGDYIKGITLDTSTTNAVINAFGVIYFVMRNKYIYTLLCMLVLLLTGSNITNILLCFTLLYMFVLQSTKNQKSIIVICLLLMVSFWVKISPQNSKYITTAYEKFFLTPTPVTAAVKDIPITLQPDSVLTPEERKQKTAQRFIDSVYVVSTKNMPASNIITAELKDKPIQLPQPNIHSPSFQHRDDTTAVQLKLLTFKKTDSLQQPVAAVSRYKMPGKAIALIQTFNYLKQHPEKIITGTGAGMFSSKLAFRISALKIAGGYPEKYAFVNNDFKKNNLALYVSYFTKPAGQHSLINAPNSTYTQLISEYGAVGICAFVFLYLGFFFKQAKKLAYGIPVLLLMTGLFFMEYWFEQLSIVVLFELLLFVDIKEMRREGQPA